MKLLFVGDVHLSDRPPSTRTDEYRDQILAKLEAIGKAAHKVDRVVFAGDIFHSKIPAKTSHETVSDLIDVFREYPAPPLVLPGNHDYKGANVDELVRAPLWVVAQSGTIQLFGIPRLGRITDAEHGVTFCGIREEEPIEAFSEKAIGSDVVVAHSPIFPEGQMPPYPHWQAGEVAAEIHKIKKSEQRPKLVLYGHIHDPHGAHSEEGIVFVNPGSLSRGSLYETDPGRAPQVAHVLLGGGRAEVEVTFVKVPHEPMEKVFRIESEAQKKAHESNAAEWAAELSDARVEAFSIERVIAGIGARDDAAPEVKARAVELIEGVS